MYVTHTLTTLTRSHPLTHTHSLTHLFTNPLTHPPTHSLTHPPTHPPTDSLTLSPFLPPSLTYLFSPQVRDYRAGYAQSLGVLKAAKDATHAARAAAGRAPLVTKTSLMLGGCVALPI